MIKKYLDQENCKHRKKIIVIITIVVLIIGLFLGVFLLSKGISNLNGKVNIENLEKERSKLRDNLVSYESNKNEEFLKNSFSEEYYRIDNEIKKLNSRLIEIENNINNDKKNSNSIQSIAFIILGSLVIIITLMISSSIIVTIYRQKNELSQVPQVVFESGKEELDHINEDLNNDENEE